jgi:hypothetical protein
MPVDAGVSPFRICTTTLSIELSNASQTTAGKSDRPALKEDTLAAETSSIRNSKL